MGYENFQIKRLDVLKNINGIEELAKLILLFGREYISDDELSYKNLDIEAKQYYLSIPTNWSTNNKGMLAMWNQLSRIFGIDESKWDDEADRIACKNNIAKYYHSIYGRDFGRNYPSIKLMENVNLMHLSVHLQIRSEDTCDVGFVMYIFSDKQLSEYLAFEEDIKKTKEKQK